MTEQVEFQSCEFCGKDSPIDTMTIHDDCWVCETCDASFREAFAKCEHQWKPHVDHMGDAGQYCTRCTGFVRNEDMADLGLDAS